MNKQDKENKAHAVLVDLLKVLTDGVDVFPVEEIEKEEIGIALVASLASRMVAAASLREEAVEKFMTIFTKHYNLFAKRDGFSELGLKKAVGISND